MLLCNVKIRMFEIQVYVFQKVLKDLFMLFIFCHQKKQMLLH